MSDIYVFGGDSFTWGSGLELYQNTPFWIDRRNKHSTWQTISEYMSTPESVEFRNSFRFPGLIASHFNATSIVHDENGGGLCKGAHFIDSHINKLPKAVVYQFTCMSRMTFHFSQFCSCNICTTPYGCIPNIVNYYFDCLRKLVNKEKFTEKDLFFLARLKEVEGIEITDAHLQLLVDRDNPILKLFHPMFNRHMEYFINNFIAMWIEKTKVLLINSWELETSKLIESNNFLKKYLVPLKGYDGNYYLNYKEWENTFPHRFIADEFKGSENYHSTLLQHRYLADSIIESLES